MRLSFCHQFAELSLISIGGKARSISIMERILKKLRAAIASLLRLSSRRGPALDYESLKSLSNASRIEAIQAIDHLSRRLGSSASHTSLVTYSSKPSTTPTSVSERPRGRRHNSTSSSSSSSSNSPPKLNKKKSSSSSSSSSSHKSSRRTPTISEEVEEVLPPTPTKQRRPSRSSPVPSDEGEQQQECSYYDEAEPCYSYSVPYQVRSPSRGRTAQLRATATTAAAPNRISMMSVSSNSTKIGEIPEHKWRPHHNNLAAITYSSDEYNVAPSYPLKPYLVPPPKHKPSFFGGLFGRKKRV